MHHGICGDSQSEYLIHAVESLLHQGYRVIVFIARGCGGLKLTTKASFNASRLHDIELAIASTRASFPEAVAIFGLSYSLGAGIMLNHLGKSRDTLLDGAVCVSPPWNLMVSTAAFPLFSPILALSLKLYAFCHIELLVTNWRDMLYLIFAVTMYQVETFFLHLHGYESLEDYYVDSSAAYSSHNITVPTLAISAEDDPVCCHSASSLDYLGPGLVIVKTLTGGHLGFVEGLLSPTGWIERVASEWFSILLSEKRRCNYDGADSDGVLSCHSVLNTAVSQASSNIYHYETIMAWDEASGEARWMKMFAIKSAGSIIPKMSLSVADKGGVAQLPSVVQLFNASERPQTPLTKSMSGWSVGMLMLPPLSTKGELRQLHFCFMYYLIQDRMHFRTLSVFSLFMKQDANLSNSVWPIPLLSYGGLRAHCRGSDYLLATWFTFPPETCFD